MQNVIGRAIVRVVRASRVALARSRHVSSHALAAGVVTAGALLVETSLGPVKLPIGEVVADVATLAIAAHAVCRIARCGTRLSTTELLVRSIDRSARAREVRAGRYVRAFDRWRSGSLRIDVNLVSESARRLLVTAAWRSCLRVVPGANAASGCVAYATTVARNVAFVRAIEAEAERLVAGDCARAPIGEPVAFAA